LRFRNYPLGCDTSGYPNLTVSCSNQVLVNVLPGPWSNCACTGPDSRAVSVLPAIRTRNPHNECAEGRTMSGKAKLFKTDFKKHFNCALNHLIVKPLWRCWFSRQGLSKLKFYIKFVDADSRENCTRSASDYRHARRTSGRQEEKE